MGFLGGVKPGGKKAHRAWSGSHPSSESGASPTSERLLLVAAVAAAALWAASRVVSSGDLWVALGCGRFMLEHGVGRVDPFSFTSPPGNWINQNWLSHILFTQIHSVAGLDGIAAWRIIVSGLILGLAAWTAVRLGASRTTAALAAVALGIVGRFYIDARPNLHTIAMCAGLLAWLAADGPSHPRRYFIPVLMAVFWSNLHGGFLFGVLALGVAAGVRSLRDRRPARSLILPAAVLLAAIISPYGIANLTHPWEISAGPAAEHWRRVAEWRSAVAPGALEDSGVRAFWAILLAGVGAAIIEVVRRGGRSGRDEAASRSFLTAAAVALLACALALTSRRFVPIFAVAALPPIAATIARRWPGFRLRGSIAVVLGVALLAGAGADFATRLVAANGLWPRSVPWSARAVRLNEQPVEAAEFVVSSGIRGRLLTEWIWGGYLLYRAPVEEGGARYRIYIDGRAQAAYPVDVSVDYDAVQAAGARRDVESIRAFLDRYEIDVCLLDRRGSGLAAIIPEMQGWSGVYADEKSVVAVRASLEPSVSAGRFPDLAIEEASAAFRLRTGGGSIAEAMEHAVRSVRARPTTVGVTEMTRLALASSSGEMIARAAAECDRILAGTQEGVAYDVLTTRANTAQCRSVLAGRLGDEGGAARFRAEALRLAAEVDGVAPRYLR